MSNKYNNPPLEEVVCEIHFGSDEEWDLTYPSGFYDKIKEKFPTKKTKKMPSFGVSVGVQGVGITPNESQRFILQGWNETENLVAQIADNLLIINSLKPYIHWESFKEIILECLKYYREVANPTSIQKLSLKYINKLDVGNKHSYQELKKIFNILPSIPESIEGDANSLQMIVEIPYNENREILAIQQATLKPEQNKQAPVLFELNYILLNPDAVSFDTFEQWIENAHTRIENVFENGLTDEIKSKFN